MLKNAIWLFSLSFILFIVFLPSYTRMQDLKRKNNQYVEQIKALKVLNAKLQAEKRRLIEDPAYLEKIARQKMGLVRKGEVVYKITPVDPKTATTVKPKTAQTAQTSKPSQPTIKGFKK